MGAAAFLFVDLRSEILEIRRRLDRREVPFDGEKTLESIGVVSVTVEVSESRSRRPLEFRHGGVEFLNGDFEIVLVGRHRRGEVFDTSLWNQPHASLGKRNGDAMPELLDGG